MFTPKDWNIYDALQDKGGVPNRTNNPLERYNGHLNSLFATPHPNLTVFADIIRGDAE
jgi:hypothetical protein